jgi:hypothetical protein
MTGTDTQPDSPRLHYAGAVLWSSFLAACAGTMVFFAMFDPARLAEITTWPVSIDRRWGYTIGFFAFWLLTACSSLITLVLILPSGDRDARHTNE